MQHIVRECYLYGFQFAARKYRRCAFGDSPDPDICRAVFSVISTIAAVPVLLLVREADLD